MTLRLAVTNAYSLLVRSTRVSLACKRASAGATATALFGAPPTAQLPSHVPALVLACNSLTACWVRRRGIGMVSSLSAQSQHFPRLSQISVLLTTLVLLVAQTIESDFYATEAGRQHFTDQLTSIRYVRRPSSTRTSTVQHHAGASDTSFARVQCVQETCNFDTVFAYLTCGNYDFRYDLSGGEHVVKPTQLDHELTTLSVCAASASAARCARHGARDHDVRHRAEGRPRPRQGDRGLQVPHVSLLRDAEHAHRPPQLLLYLATAPEEKARLPPTPCPSTRR